MRREKIGCAMSGSDAPREARREREISLSDGNGTGRSEGCWDNVRRSRCGLA